MAVNSRVIEVHNQGAQLTLGDLRQFIAALDDAGAADSTSVDAKVSWRGGLQRLKAAAVRFGDDEPGEPPPGRASASLPPPPPRVDESIITGLEGPVKRWRP